MLASPYGHAVFFSTERSGFQLLHPTVRYVRFHIKSERKGSKSTQAVYFWAAKVFSAESFSKSHYGYVGFRRSRWHTQCDLWVTTKSNSQNLTKDSTSSPRESPRGIKDSGTRKQPASKTTADCGAISSLKVVSRPSVEETTLHNEIDLLMGLVQDMAPVVKTL